MEMHALIFLSSNREAPKYSRNLRIQMFSNVSYRVAGVIFNLRFDLLIPNE